MNWREIKTRVTNGMQRFMYGRHGIDELTLSILAISLIVAFAATMFRQPWLQLTYYVGVVGALYRALSKNLFRRRRENQLFLERTRSLRSWYKVQKRIVQERKTHRHFKCPACKQRLRVPVGKGKITITCSKCGEKFSRKS